MKSISNLWLLAAVLALAGCGADTSNLPATVDASGVVLLDGEPVHGASVVFAPVPPDKYPAFAITDESGRFDLKAFEAKGGAVPGAYQVQVSKTVEVQGGATPPPAAGGDDAAHAAESPESAGVSWKNALPQKYASVATSGLEVTIPDTGRSDIEIDLATGP